MDFRFIPYTQINGAWTLPDSVMSDMWDEIVNKRIVNKLFYGGTVTNVEQFIVAMKSPANIVHTVWGEDGMPYVLAWLNSYLRNHAYGHFTYFPRALGHKTSLDLGKKVID